VNLVDNAIKFTAAGSVRICVRLGDDASEGRHLRFEIADTGVGIMPQDLPRLFDPFWQADLSSQRRHGGAGLGLAICRRLVELMGGKIGIASEPATGSTFWFTLPLSRGAPG
jgi:two-component system sensor histidine kinase/response regulator